ncbi:histidinol-phosphate transaminase [Symbiobacterium thermophilum]|uniref:Histidinol-phosphate aminotransferase n=1 Tax=Symbiobacterium thermophilum TaxID=2734 RepID=A0A953HY43_SYMTR|nr:histidinol-phosphate transaminase [Symbiobacterium thermophilum]MBY6274787.1 histidinol-phosphate transaminase [Symbiobacterium thermophilum]
MSGVRTAVRRMKPYVPGKPVEDVQRELGLHDLVKLNQNENPLGPSPRAVAAARAAMAQVHTYPEGTARRLRERLAQMWNLPADWFLIGNGSDEVFRLLAEVYLEPGDRVVVPEPSFAAYRFVAELMGAEVVAVPLAGWTMDLPAMAEAAARGAKLLFLCRPNNPTGTVFAEADLRAALERVPPSTLVVVDEAYREFDETPFDSRALVQDYPNVVIARTFSKIYGMAGFRLGYGVMRPEVLAPLYTARDPFSVNGLAVAAGLAALEDAEHVERTRALTREGKAYLYAAFQRLGLGYVPSEANFVLFDAGRPAAEVFDALLRRGVLVRPCGSFGLPDHLRVTVGTPEQNRRFVEALKAALGEG